MPYDDPDPTDPTILVGVALPAGEDAAVEMAYVFAEEFARLGFSESRLLSLFHHPFYAGAHQALEILGEEKIHSIIRETLSLWGRLRYVVEDAAERRPWNVPLDALRSATPSQPRHPENEVDYESSL